MRHSHRECKRNRRRRLLLAAAAALPTAACGGNTIHPPHGITEPADVAVLDHGRHATLVVAPPGEAALRWAYGDWDWYALRATGPVEASGAALGPSKAALGRQELPGPFAPERVLRAVPTLVEDPVFLQVEAENARRLNARLEAMFIANSGRRITDHPFGLEFVPHPRPCSLSRNSNHVVAAWLEEMGVRVEGTAFWSEWRKAQPSEW